MPNDIEILMKRLLEYFPATGTLLYDNFACDNIKRFYCGDENKIKKAFEFFSRPWTEIQWENVNEIASCTRSGYFVLTCLPPIAFIHIFPSILIWAIKAIADPRCAIFFSFLDYKLNLNNAKNMERDFYLSLPGEAKKIIAFVLGKVAGEETFKSYWHTFHDMSTKTQSDVIYTPQQEAKILKNVGTLTKMLIEFFPAAGTLSYGDFICDGVSNFYYGNEKMIQNAFDFFSPSWTEIQWENVREIDCDDVSGDIVISFLSPKAFIHMFPSLLVWAVKSGNDRDNVFGHFVNNHLDLNKVIQNWKRDFYFSLPDGAKKVIALVLRTTGCDEAVESYWNAFRDTSGGERIIINPPHSQVIPDFMLMELDMAFRRIEAGRFRMGSSVDKRYYDMYGEKIDMRYFNPYEAEKIHHSVRITRPFYIGQYPVTQAQWLKVMGDNPSFFVRNDEHPVESISWNDAQAFIAKLNLRDGWHDNLEAYKMVRQFIARLNEESGLDEGAGYVFRLPTEAEWEYACRAVSETDPERETKENWRWFFGDDPAELEHYAWFEQNADLTTHPVGQKRPNPWGLYDLYGNVWEWVWDYFGEYPDGEVTDPTEPLNRLAVRVRRGGSFDSPVKFVRSAQRSGHFPHGRCGFSGLRLVLAPRLRESESRVQSEPFAKPHIYLISRVQPISA